MEKQQIPRLSSYFDLTPRSTALEAGMLTITLPIGLTERGAAGMPFSTIFETEIPRENQHVTDHNLIDHCPNGQSSSDVSYSQIA